jgi:hypothetical protein
LFRKERELRSGICLDPEGAEEKDWEKLGGFEFRVYF